MPSAAADLSADAKRGAKAFQTCVACHSLEPGRHMSGPVLAGVLGRKAGTAKDFMRYSDAILKSEVVWNERTLDEWLANPGKMIPGNEMAFPGIPDARARRDLIAYLKAVSEGGEAPRGPRMPRLKTDSTEFGPDAGRPVLVGVGMRGDRAAIVFAGPDEIATMVKSGC